MTTIITFLWPISEMLICILLVYQFIALIVAGLLDLVGSINYSLHSVGLPPRSEGVKAHVTGGNRLIVLC